MYENGWRESMGITPDQRRKAIRGGILCATTERCLIWQLIKNPFPQDFNVAMAVEF
jgi:hypothetical protein